VVVGNIFIAGEESLKALFYCKGNDQIGRRESDHYGEISEGRTGEEGHPRWPLSF